MNSEQKSDIAIIVLFGTMLISAMIGVIAGETHHFFTLAVSSIMIACAMVDYIHEKTIIKKRYGKREQNQSG